MPPKKNVDKTSEPVKPAKEKVSLKRKVKEKVVKPKFKIPTVIKQKISSFKMNVAPEDEKQVGRKNKNKGNNSPNALTRKIELANEVALAQPTKQGADELDEKVKKEATVNNQRSRKKRIQVAPEEEKQVGRKKNKGNNSPNALTRKIELANEVALAQLTKQGAAELDEKVKKEGKLIKRHFMRKGIKDAKKDKIVVKRKKAIPNKDPNAPPRKKVKKNKNFDENDTLKTEADSTSKEVSRRRSTRNKVSVNPTVSESPEKKQINSPKGKTKDVSASEASSSILKGMSSILTNGKQKTQNVSERKDLVQVASRKTSTSECLSWTKDISSSSTTSCLTVGSNDFVRFDKKFPQLKIPNIAQDKRMTRVNESDSEKSSSSSSGCSTSSSSSGSPSGRSASGRSPSGLSGRSTSAARSLRLSTSSLSPSKQSNPPNDEDDLTYAFQKLTAKLKRIDLEAISWIGYENQTIDAKVDAIQDKIITLLTEENEVINCCRKIKEMLGVEEGSVAKDTDNVVTQVVNNFIDKSEEDENFTSPKSRNVMLNQNCENNEEALQTPKEYDNFYEDYTSDKVKYASFEQPFNDDDCDDALSLFAESITGFESSRINSSANSICANASDFEEYIPQPMAPRERIEAPRYIPTKIKDSGPALQNKLKTVCEKQNADSTSISKETENDRNSKLQPEEDDANRSSQNVISQTVIRPTYKVPLPPSEFTKQIKSNASTIPPLNGIKSVVFKGVCFFNLMLSCKKIHCQYPHHILDTSEVSNRLLDLSTDMFVHEYLLINNWPELRRRYGLCYVGECVRRKLTRLLVEMSIHFISKARVGVPEDAELKVHSIERTLLYLNNIDLHTCEDLLRTKINDDCLCDIYMDTIAVTQNFSRFKVVFVKLVDLMVRLGRTFQMNVAGQILERVCILRCEKPIFEAMVKILENTDEKILQNPMMKQFEEHLSVLAPELYSKFFGMMKSPHKSGSGEGRPSSRGPDLDQRMLHSEREQRYTSPDTTKIDMNKSIEDPMPQKVKIIRPSIYSLLFKQNSNSDNSEKRFRPWRGKFRGHMNNGPYVPREVMRSPMRPPMLKRRVHQHHVAFGLSPSTFPRRQPPGPDYY